MAWHNNSSRVKRSRDLWDNNSSDSSDLSDEIPLDYRQLRKRRNIDNTISQDSVSVINMTNSENEDSNTTPDIFNIAFDESETDANVINNETVVSPDLFSDYECNDAENAPNYNANNENVSPDLFADTDGYDSDLTQMDQDVRDFETDEPNDNETNDILFGDTAENTHSFESETNYDADCEDSGSDIEASYQKWCEKHNKY